MVAANPPARGRARQPLPGSARRYGELEHIAERWREATANLPQSSLLIVNADDPLVATLAAWTGRRAVRFGIDDPRISRATLQHAADSKYCVRCGAPYAYAAAYVGHLGDYRCPECGHSRPPLDIAARTIVLDGLDSVRFELVTPEGSARVRLPLPGLYNVYNALAAASIALAFELPLAQIVAGLETARPAFGRLERVDVDGRRLLMLPSRTPPVQTRRWAHSSTGGFRQHWWSR